MSSIIDKNIYLLDLKGKVLDSNDYNQIGKIFEVPTIDLEKVIYTLDNLSYIVVRKYDTPVYYIALEDEETSSFSLLEIIHLFFNEENNQMTKTNFLREVLLNNISKVHMEELKEEFSITDKEHYYVINVLLKREYLKNAKIIIENLFVLDKQIKIDNETIAIISSKEFNLVEELSLELFSEISSELGVKPKISIGTEVDSFFDLHKSFDAANKNIRISEVFDIPDDLLISDELLIQKMIYNLPMEKLKAINIENQKKYKEIFTDEELILTAKHFFRNNLNITETSKNLYVHRNTLVYRINKMEKLSGINLKEFSDAMKFYIILLIKKICEK